ncbi:MAG: hypothetical protein ACRYG2_00725 [Janthinobacterium lividum]
MSESVDGRVLETDDPRVDEALRGVDGLDEAPVDEHAERLSTAHSALQEVLRTPVGPDAGPASVRRP